MAPNPPFGRDDDAASPRPEDTKEGVRLLDAEEVAKAAERAETAKRRRPDEKKYGDRPEPPPADVKPAMRFPLADAADPNALERPRAKSVTPPTADDPTGSRPIISVGPPTGETQLPHWTEPATGEVPRVVIGEVPSEEDDDRWAAFTSTPRWRDENTDWARDEDHEGFGDLVEADVTQLGALDESDRMMDEDYLTFDDLEVPDAAAPKAPPRGTANDPIKIQRSGRTPAPPTPAPPGRSRSRARIAPGTGPRDEPVPVGAGGSRDKEQAIQVGVGLAVGALIIFLLGFKFQWVPLILIVAAIVGALAEFFNATARAGFRPIREIGLLAAGALPIAAYAANTHGIPTGESGMMLVLFLTVAASLAWYLFGAGKGRPVANMAITWAGVLYVGALGAYGALILRAGPWLNVASDTTDRGVQYFILIAFGTTICDVVGYLLGSKIGKTPLSAASPNKTREGLLAGMAASVLIVLVLGGLFHLGVNTIGEAFVLGVVLAVVSPLGDLFESMIKRDLGVKDMGSVIPSHGGLLDRLDAYLFTLPAAYYTLRMLGLL